MANTLTGLIPDLYEAMDVISRELTGYIGAVSRSSKAETAALNEVVKVPITNTPTTADNTPGVTAPDTGDGQVDWASVTISKSKHAPVRWNGEETLGLENAGTFSTIAADRFYQAMRVLVNEIEADIHGTVRRAASRANGTAGTTPFGTAGNMSDLAGALRIMEDNGAPTGDLQVVLGGAAVEKMRGVQSNLFKVNEAGTANMLRNGITDRLMNFAVRKSAAVAAVTQGTGASYLVNNASGIAVGGTAVAADTGTGTILAGDVVTFAADSANKYVVGSALSAGSFSVNKPGARILVPDNNAITVGGAFTANTYFARSAVVLATRAPAKPKGGDSADDIISITDPVTGLTFEIAVYRQFLQTVYHVRLAWGWAAIKPEHIGLLLG